MKTLANVLLLAYAAFGVGGTVYVAAAVIRWFVS